MCQYSSPDGFADDWHLVHLGAARRRRRRAGVHRGDRGGRRRPHQPARPRHLERRATSSALGAHRRVRPRAGRRGRRSSSRTPAARRRTPRRGTAAGACQPAEGGWQPVAPVRRAVRARVSPTPRALTPGDLRADRRRLRRRGRAARRGRASTWSRSTRRTATCCTSSCRRSRTGATTRTAARSSTAPRFALEVVRAVRAVWPERLPLFLRISATDWVDGGWDADAVGGAGARAEGAAASTWSTARPAALVPHARIPLGAGLPGAVRARASAARRASPPARSA